MGLEPGEDGTDGQTDGQTTEGNSPRCSIRLRPFRVRCPKVGEQMVREVGKRVAEEVMREEMVKGRDGVGSCERAGGRDISSSQRSGIRTSSHGEKDEK